MKSRQRFLLLLSGLILLLAAGFSLFWRGTQSNPANSSNDTVRASAGTVQSPAQQPGGSPQKPAIGANSQKASSAASLKETSAFRQWLGEYRKKSAEALPETARQELIERGREIATRRRDLLVSLIPADPEKALAQALTFDEYEALPVELRPLAERPFSARTDYRYYPVCGGPGQQLPPGAPDHFVELDLTSGTTLQAFTYGQRNAITTKRGLPVQGIQLDNLAAVRDAVIQELTPAEVPVVARLAGSDPASVPVRSFATGQEIHTTPIYGVAGGRLLAFANENELMAVNQKLAKLDELPGPKAGSSQIFLPDGTSPTGAVDLNYVTAQADYEASTWTETKKKYFMIRVDFSDLPGDPVAQADASTQVNGATSNMIRAMSYGKTWVEATISANCYRMPQTGAYYADKSNASYGTSGFSSKSSELLRDARNTFRATQSGADAAINIGPVSSAGSGNGGGLGDYDIVCVSFANIGMYSGGVFYAGLGSVAGGDQWLQAANYTSVIVHETGHNYGLGHASFWWTTDGSVVGTGSSVEYGDPYDVMGAGPAPQGDFNAQAKALLNWITASQWVDATAAGSNTYRIYREDNANTTGNLRGVRVTKSGTGASAEYYWIDYKASFPNYPHVQKGAHLLWQKVGQSRCWLLDTTPTTSGDKTDAPIDLGRTYADTSANVYFTPLAQSGTGSDAYIDVQVNIGPFPGNQPPTADPISGPPSLAARATGTFSVNATDSNGDALAYYWTTGDGLPNNNTSALSHSWIVGGTYAVNSTVTDMKGGTATVGTSVVVIDPVDTWTSGSTGATTNLREAVYSRGRFVAVEYWGTVYLSWDGVNWSSVGVPSSFDSQPHLASGTSVFVLAGKLTGTAAAQIAYSLDGRIWNTANFPAGIPAIREVAWGGDRFVAIADSGTVLVSMDGINWALTTIPTMPNLRHVVWDGTSWVAVAYNSATSHSEIIWSSIDGVNWTQTTANLGIDCYHVYASGGAVFAIGWYGGITYSTDEGVTWQSAALPGTTRWSTFSMTISDSGLMLCTAEAMDETGTPRALLVSTDGRTWGRTTGNGGNTTVASANSVVYGSGKFFSIENSGIVHSSNLLNSSNSAPVASLVAAPVTGTARQPIRFAAAATDANGDPLSYSWDVGSQYPITDGTEVAPTFPFGGTYTVTLRVSDSKGGLVTQTQTITISDPARTFTQRTSGVTKNLSALANNGNIAVAAGDSGTILTSSNGVTWTTRTVTEYAANMYFYGLTWDGSRFVLVGKDYNFTPGAWVSLIYTSTNGLTWTQRYRPSVASPSLQAVASGNSAIVTVASSDTVLTSTNGGVNWSPVTATGTTTSINGVAYGNGTFVFTGYVGGNGAVKVYTSADGLNWLNYSSGANIASWEDLRKVAWVNDRFISSGWYSGLCTSTDLGHTFAPRTVYNYESVGMTFGDNIYFGAGIDLSASSANTDFLSLDGVTWYNFPMVSATTRTAATFFQHTFITAGGSGQIWQSGTLNSQSGFAQWQSTYFPNGGLSALPDRDPDGDGISNIVEYAMGRAPSSGLNGNGAIGRAVNQSGRSWLHLDLPEPAMPDVNYVVQGTTGLNGSWTDLARKNGAGAWQWVGPGTSHINLGTATGGQLPTEIGCPDGTEAASKYFLRLKVEQP